MTEKELNETINELREAFSNKFPKKSPDQIDEMILDSYFQAFINGKMSREDLKTIGNFMGYEILDEILNQVEEELN